MLDFVLMTPIYRGVDGMTCWCVEKAHQAGLNNFLWVVGSEGKGDALICRNRSIAATSFMEGGISEYMIFLDSDIVFEPQHLKMIHEDLKSGKHIVGGVYPTRDGSQSASYFAGGIDPGELGVHEILFLATGFMGISRYALYKIAQEYKYSDGRPFPILHPDTPGYRSYPFFESSWTDTKMPDGDGNTMVWLSEDYDFCEKARAVGVKVYADTRVQLGHRGSRVVTFHDVIKYRKEMAELEKKIEDAKTTQKRADNDYTDFVGESVKGAIG